MTFTLRKVWVGKDLINRCTRGGAPGRHLIEEVLQIILHVELINMIRHIKAEVIADDFLGARSLGNGIPPCDERVHELAECVHVNGLANGEQGLVGAEHAFCDLGSNVARGAQCIADRHTALIFR
ncbi:hypothetical protein ATCV1_z606L [Acanthocystis turfacea chlorella virus 1]|uniref:Uncharacterized protein z606L n=1 Tax=Chlorovirus heliozoae TaxID=322019 RepID=A7K9L6_9PHYC|nr:hypothetical protein ATCV1_z606L [Acanthocystis turfacea chlorella virus 1]ABT16740.1 hypothetical protein ATCV1_z606L [Acanthocystis turfacea chlorella virus 1]